MPRLHVSISFENPTFPSFSKPFSFRSVFESFSSFTKAISVKENEKLLCFQTLDYAYVVDSTFHSPVSPKFYPRKFSASMLTDHFANCKRQLRVRSFGTIPE